MPMERFSRTLNINLFGTFMVIRSAAPLMMETNPMKREREVSLSTRPPLPPLTAKSARRPTLHRKEASFP